MTYNSFEELLASLHSPFAYDVDVQRSAMIANEIDAHTQRCYQNATRALIRLRMRNVSYVEGYAAALTKPHDGTLSVFHHGWLLDQHTRTVIDPTWHEQRIASNVYVPIWMFSATEIHTRYADRSGTFMLPITRMYEGFERGDENALRSAQSVVSALNSKGVFKYARKEMQDEQGNV
jgi:hypothetical protein